MKPNHKGLVLVVEDEFPHRQGLEIALRQSGFEVIAVPGAEEAHAVVRAEPRRIFDVAVLDMILKKHDRTARTGAALGAELKRELPVAPEFLIYTAFGRAEFFEEALQLGVEAYIHKTVSWHDLAIHVAALTLKRRLTQVPEELRRRWAIPAKDAARPQGPVLRFCSDFLLPTLTPFSRLPVLLVVQEHQERSTRTWVCRAGADATEASRDVEQVLRAPRYSVDFSEPKSLDRTDLENLGINDPLLGNGGVCVAPLAEMTLGGVDASVVVIVTLAQDSPAELAQATTFCKALLRYCRKAIQQSLGWVSKLIEAASQVAEAKRRQQMIIANTAAIFLKVGQEVLYQLQEYHRLTGAYRAAQLERLEELASDLRDGGELLEDIGRTGDGGAARVIAVPDVVRTLWLDVGSRSVGGAELGVKGDASLVGDREALQLALGEILGWLVRQTQNAERGARLTVECSETPTRALIDIACDSPSLRRGRRKAPLPARAEAEYLRPGPQLGLSLAQVILELRSGGQLQDLSRERPDLAYFFRVSVPRSPVQPPVVM